MIEWFTATPAFLPNWVWLVIALAVVLIVVLIVVYCCSAKKERNRAAAPVNEETSESPADTAVTADTVKEETPPEKSTETEEKKNEPARSQESRGAGKDKEKVMAQKKEEKPAEAVKKTPNKTSKPAETAQKPADTAKKAAKPAQTPADKQEKSSSKTYHISLRKGDGKWQVKIGGGEKAIKLFDTQAQAIDYAKSLADNQDANIVIHKKDGSFRKLTY